jgi:hypothetical protein
MSISFIVLTSGIGISVGCCSAHTGPAVIIHSVVFVFIFQNGSLLSMFDPQLLQI